MYLLGCDIYSRLHEVPTSMEQRGITGRSTSGNARSAIVYLYTATASSRHHDFDSQMRRFLRLKKIRLSELRRVMLQIQALLTQDEVTRAHSSTDVAGLLFEQIKSRLPFSSKSTKGRGRRLDQLSWRTLARELKLQNI
ncbi:hypothetical protein GQ600_9568 [Phytophthora cactorum]|nr:hypothetical protein GQ600_9568 [Phytophthora cactorum]